MVVKPMSGWLAHRRRRNSLFAFLVTLCATVVGQVAQFIPAAADTDVDQFLLQGIAQVNPAIPPADAFPAGFLDAGTYTFLGGCIVGASSDDLGVATSCIANSSGNYLNVICGTGTASGVAVVDTASEGVPFTYTIVFEDGIGSLAVTSPIGGWGFVQIIPTNTTSGGCVTAAVSTFNVTAYVQVEG